MPGGCSDGLELQRCCDGPDDLGRAGSRLQSGCRGLESDDGPSRQDLRELFATKGVYRKPARSQVTDGQQIAQFPGPNNRLISKVRVSGLDLARAVDLVAAGRHPLKWRMSIRLLEKCSCWPSWRAAGGTRAGRRVPTRGGG